MPAFIFGKIQRTNGNYKQYSATRYSTQAPLFRLWDRVAKISTPGKCVSGYIRKEALSLRVIMSYANQNAILSHRPIRSQDWHFRYTEQFGHTTSTLALDLSQIASMMALCPLLMKQLGGTVLTTFLAHI